MKNYKIKKILTNYRQEQRLSYAELGKKLGVQPITVWRWLNTHANPSPINKHHILKLLGFSPANFIQTQGDKYGRKV